MRVIAGSARRSILRTIEGEATRPTTDRIKETLFNIIQNDVEGSSFLDLFAGSGAIGIEALSRGAASCVFVDRESACVEVIKENLENTSLSELATVYRGDACGITERLDCSFDIIFMDPPYNSYAWKNVLAAIAKRRDVLLKEDAYIIIEDSIDADASVALDMGFSLLREKCYKNNKHIFLECLK